VGEPGDAVLTATPIYPPFMSAPRNQGHETISVPLVPRADGRYEFDWPAMERAVTPRTKVFFLCNPHNPVGRVFTRAELETVAAFCARHNLVLVSDDVHCDLILDDLPHIPIATLSADAAARSVTLLAPSKTYNIAGLGCSLAVIPDAKLRSQFVRAMAGIVPEMNPLSYAACEAAFRDSEPWRQALLAYLRGNRDLIASFLKENLPMIAMTPCEATYLAWLDVSALNLQDAGAYFEQHGLGFADGAQYGAPPGKFVRLNFGCPRSILREALARLQRAVAAR
jgi:cystathionine beta-lyase